MKKLVLTTALAVLIWPAQLPAADDVPIAQRVDAIFATWDSTHSPGCALAVARDSRVVYRGGYGMANLEQGVAITPSAVCGIT